MSKIKVKKTEIEELDLDDLSDELFFELLDICYNKDAVICIDSENISVSHLHSDRCINHTLDEIVDDFLISYVDGMEDKEELVKLSKKFKNLAEKIDRCIKETII